MKAPQGSSESVVVSDLKQAQVITDRTQLRRLSPFMGQEVTIKEVAAHLNLSVTATYKIAMRFLELGLVYETKREPRKGRAIRYYSAPAEFFVPFSVIGLEQIGEHNRQVHLDRFNHNQAQLLRRELAAGWGTRTARLPSGEAIYEVSSVTGEVMEQLADNAPLLLSGWNILKLTPQEARTLQRQLMELFRPFFNRDNDGDSYLTGIFLVRDYGIQP